MALLATSIVLAVWATAMLTPFGRVAYVYVFLYAEFYMGVLTLVSLSITVMIGLVATDRLVLSIRQRVLLQSAHRTTGVIAVASLVVHVLTKLAIAHIGVLDIFVPFLAGFNTLYVGLGTVAGMLMVSVLWTGLARAKFAGRGKPWMWRSMHSVAYLAWPIALVHGLAAGRAAATWVVVSYVVCVMFVLVALAVRLSVSLNRRKDFSSTSTGSIKPVGSLVPTQAPAPKKRIPSRRRDAEPARAESAAPAAVETWAPAAAPVSSPARPVSSMPVSAMPVSGMPVSAAPYAEDGYGRRRYADDEPRGRRYADDDAPPARRYADDDTDTGRRSRRVTTEGFDEETGRISRRAVEDERYLAEPPARGRRYAEPEEEPAPRSRRADADEPGRRSRRIDAEEYLPARSAEMPPSGPRYPDEVAVPQPRRGADDAPRGRRYAEPDEPRGRRYADDDGYDDAPRSRAGYPDGRWAEDPAPRSGRAARYAEDDRDAPRARRDRGADVDRADSGRHSRSEFVDLAPAADPWRDGPADPHYMEPDETPTLVDMAARRARRQTQQQEPARASRGARRNRGRNTDEALDDQQYWRQLRGEAQ
ncbi:translation initiation factor III [Jidongwangia harbinensis]|uniref:translation initiation factor III n=1 Tax=Jidongwangia harbinensis TaxID=2878561 RepID=UPI001CD92629|nr:translation initiation factor III [Jidongwangia harbinensis]MCA2217796.1 translation initiation factor III [Jidongwangia harbinensis]